MILFPETDSANRWR